MLVHLAHDVNIGNTTDGRNIYLTCSFRAPLNNRGQFFGYIQVGNEPGYELAEVTLNGFVDSAFNTLLYEYDGELSI